MVISQLLTLIVYLDVSKASGATKTETSELSCMDNNLTISFLKLYCPSVFGTPPIGHPPRSLSSIMIGFNPTSFNFGTLEQPLYVLRTNFKGAASLNGSSDSYRVIKRLIRTSFASSKVPNLPLSSGSVCVAS